MHEFTLVPIRCRTSQFSGAFVPSAVHCKIPLIALCLVMELGSTALPRLSLATTAVDMGRGNSSSTINHDGGKSIYLLTSVLPAKESLSGIDKKIIDNGNYGHFDLINGEVGYLQVD